MVRLFNAATRILTTGLLMAIAGAAAAQQDYPSKPIRIIVPYPPGGSNDFLARLFSPKLTETLGSQVLVDNRTAMPDTRAAITKQGLESFYATSGEIDAIRREDMATVAKLVKAANIRMQN